ncbi:MAG: hypothetical protein IPM86_01830 [Saprospiraceae bacterium]|nr:hypothetical protein [Saprospiraceae bacterium]
MDSLNYYYSSSLRPNLLSSVTDNVSPTSYDDDIDNQLPGNYSYDSIGNLVSDLQSKASISWDPYQKLEKSLETSQYWEPEAAIPTTRQKGLIMILKVRERLRK